MKNQIYYRAIWQFYKDLLPFILVFVLISKIIFGNVITVITFLTFGLLLAFLAFWLVKKQEFYFYHNVGYNKWKLFKSAFLMNLFIGTPLVIIILIIVTLFFGDTQLI